MKPPPFTYHDPTTVPEALDILAGNENVKVLAGGQSLMPMLNMRYVQPDHIVDLNRIPGLAYIREERDTIHIGAMTRQRDLEYSGLIADRLPLLREALMNVGHRQTRNRGTIGGSLCHLDPAAEMLAIATVYGAVIEVSSKAGARDIPIDEFPAGFMTPAIATDEILVGLRLKPWPAGHGSAFLEFSRRVGDFAVASVAVLLHVDGGTIRRAAICVGGLGTAPRRVAEAETLLCGTAAGDDVFRAAADVCGRLDAEGDVHASAAYRQRLARVLAYRALACAHARATRSRADGLS